MATLIDLREAVRVAPDSGPSHFELGFALARRGEYAEALEHFRHAVELEPRNGLHHRAVAHLLSRGPGFEEEATRHFEAAVACAPESAEAFEALGWQYAVAAGRTNDARAVCAQAIARFPDRLKSYVNLCLACAGEAGHDALWTLAESCLPANGRRDLLQFALPRALIDVGRYHEALRRAWRYGPGIAADARMLALLGRIEDVLGDVDAARHHSESALRLAPCDPGIIGQFLTQCWRRGDVEAVRRTMRTASTLRGLGMTPAARLWDAACIRDRTVLLRDDDNGFGDTLLWVRAVPLLRAAGARPIVECQSPLRQLLTSVPGVERVVVPYDDDYPSCDVEALAAFTLRMLDWDWPAIEAQTPYLRVPAAVQRTWIARRSVGDGQFRVGLEWRSETDKVTAGDPYRLKSMPLQALKPLATMPGVVCHSLHVGAAGAEELRALAGIVPVTELSRGIGDFVDTAAAISAMDAIVTVDTAVAHVAGALGTPTFVMLPFYAAWLWGDPETPSRWYPSCCLMRQSAPGAWAPVIDRIVEEIGVMSRSRASVS